MSLQLVLSHYLGGLRERNELDALLPDLLRAMGHSVLSRAQIGVAQAGVDIASTATNNAGSEEVFLYILKFGDVGREDLFSGKQAIQPSIREAYTDFARSRLSAAQQLLPKRIVVVSNGVLKQEAASAFAGIVDEVAQRPGFTLEFWGMDHLTPLIEENLFNEGLLLARGKGDLRAALAGLEESGTAIRRFGRFVDECLAHPNEEANLGAQSRQRRFLRRCATAAMGYGVLVTWGHSEGNLKPGVVAGEYLLLRLWAEAVKAGFVHDAEFLERLAAVVDVHTRALIDYFGKVSPTLLLPRAVAHYRPHRVFYSQLIFEEAGRLATLMILLQRIEVRQSALRLEVRNLLIEVINAHPVICRPTFDGQSIDLMLILVALAGEDDLISARALLNGAITALDQALRQDRDLPVDTDLLEDAIALDENEVGVRDFFQTSTLIPSLGSAAAFAGDDAALARLRALTSNLNNVTLERWFAGPKLETFSAEQCSVTNLGVSRAINGFRDSALAEAEASLARPDGATDPGALSWRGMPWEWLVAVSSRLHRHPLPTWFMAESMTVQSTPVAQETTSPDLETAATKPDDTH